MTKEQSNSQQSALEQSSHCQTRTAPIFQEWICASAQQHVNKVSMAAQDCFMQCCAATLFADMMDLRTGLQQLHTSRKNAGYFVTV